MKQTATTRYDRVKPSPGRVDEALIGAVAGGDREAFRLLYEQAAPAVLGFALSLLRSREDAEDAMQETFVRIRTAAAQSVSKQKNRLHLLPSLSSIILPECLIFQLIFTALLYAKAMPYLFFDRYFHVMYLRLSSFI